MAKLDRAIMAVATIVITSISAPADANWRCGYDRYGYHPPDFRGCDRGRRHWHRYNGYGVYDDGPYRRYSNIDIGYPGRVICYYNNGYDLRVHRVCIFP